MPNTNEINPKNNQRTLMPSSNVVVKFLSKTKQSFVLKFGTILF